MYPQAPLWLWCAYLPLLTQQAFLIGVSYITPIFGGWVADSVAGKYNTLYGSILIYFLGTALLPVVAYDYSKNIGASYDLHETGRWLCFSVSMLFISIGTGGIKANVAPFGAEQVQSLGPTAVGVFFNWFYWFINIGSLIAFTLIVYVQTEYTNGFFWGYLILTAGILITALILISGEILEEIFICRNKAKLTEL